MRKRVLEQPIDVMSIEEAVYIVKAALKNQRQLKIVTLNPEMIVKAHNNIEFQAAINNANLIIPDGTGIVWLLKIKGIETQRIAGIDLAEILLYLANKNKRKVAIFGGKKNILERCINNFRDRFPDIDFVKAVDGYRNDDENIARDIKEKSPDIIFVGLGAPRQDIWINKYSDLFPKSILIGIGGSIDIWSGKKPRAPMWIRKMNFEWLFRLIIDPKRTIRLLIALPTFLKLMYKYR